MKYNCIQAKIIDSNHIQTINGKILKVIPFNYLNLNKLRKDIYYFFELEQNSNDYIIISIVNKYES